MALKNALQASCEARKQLITLDTGVFPAYSQCPGFYGHGLYIYARLAHERETRCIKGVVGTAAKR